MTPTKNDLSEEKRSSVARLLNQALANLIDLKLQAKQAHWNVKGPNFIALHELFDDVAVDAEVYTDSIAERITALGGRADGILRSVAARTSLPVYSIETLAGRDHVDALSSAVANVGKAIRSAIELATALGDLGTADLFTEISRGLDKKLWFVESHLHGAA